MDFWKIFCYKCYSDRLAFRNILLFQLANNTGKEIEQQELEMQLSAKQMEIEILLMMSKYAFLFITFNILKFFVKLKDGVSGDQGLGEHVPQTNDIMIAILINIRKKLFLWFFYCLL